MNSRLLLTAAALAMALSGCAVHHGRDGGRGMMPKSTPPPQTGANTQNCTGPGICTISIQNPTCNPNCTATVADFIQLPPLPPSGRPIPVPIEWKLPAGFVFCAGKLDGVSIKDNPDDDFEDPHVVPPNGCRDTFHLKANNGARGKTYEYKILLRDSSNPPRLYIIGDPWIVNG